jgi:hypothetical protein
VIVSPVNAVPVTPRVPDVPMIIAPVPLIFWIVKVGGSIKTVQLFTTVPVSVSLAVYNMSVPVRLIPPPAATAAAGGAAPARPRAANYLH